MIPVRRRDALRVGAVLVTAGLSGCTFGFGGTSDEVDVDVVNEGDATRRLSVTVTFDGDVLVDETATLEPGESTRVEFRNPESAGDARVEASRPTGASTSRAVRVGPGTGIRSITVTIVADGSLNVVETRT